MNKTIRKKLSQGFTLVEIMISVAVVAVLVAVSLPAYQSFVIRSKMEDALLVLDSVRPEIEEYWALHNQLPQNDVDIGLDRPEPLDDVVRRIAISGGGVSGTTTLYVFLNEGVAPISRADGAFGLEAFPHPDGHLTWKCVKLSLDESYLPASCRNDR